MADHSNVSQGIHLVFNGFNQEVNSTDVEDREMSAHCFPDRLLTSANDVPEVYDHSHHSTVMHSDDAC